MDLRFEQPVFKQSAVEVAARTAELGMRISGMAPCLHGSRR